MDTAEEKFEKIEALRKQRYEIEDELKDLDKEYRETLASRKPLDKDKYLAMLALRDKHAEVLNELHALI